jgi:hypothetical protein
MIPNLYGERHILAVWHYAEVNQNQALGQSAKRRGMRENSPLGVDISALNLDFIKGFSQKVKTDEYGKSRRLA